MSRYRLSRLLVWALVAFFLAVLALPLVRGESPVRWGLDLAGGVRVTYRPDPASVGPNDPDLAPDALLAQAKDILASRLARSLGAVPDVVVRSDGRIVVTVPGERDQQRVLELVGKTYRLTFRLVEAGHPDPDPAGRRIRHQGRYLELSPAAFSGEMLDERHLRVLPPQPGATDARALAAEVAFRFRPPHDGAFEAFTRRHVGRDLAILLDDQLEWVGRIESAIAGEGTLAGGYTVTEAARIVDMLRAGTLPVGLVVEDLEGVGPSLGQELRASGWQAMAIAVACLVGVLGLAYGHRRLLIGAGLESLACLLLTTGGLIALFDLTVDLAAIAGLILSVGMGLDAFILVFEALETDDDDAHPTSFRQRVRRVYGMAREGGTLLHANATTLVVVALLVGNPRLGSFATFIAVGILASLITVLATRQRLLRARETRGGGTGALARLRRARPGVFRCRRIYVGLLALAIVASAIGIATGTGPRPTLGPDFEAGTQIVFTSPDEAATASTLAALAERFPGVRVDHQRLGDDGRRHLVTLGTTLTIDGSAGTVERGPSAAAVTRLIAAAGSSPESLHAIDARVAAQRLAAGLSALGLSFVCLGLYLVVAQSAVDRLLGAPPAFGTLRARALVFAGVLIAVVLDVALAVGGLAALGMSIDLPVMAALLTIIGYSVNDSVVLASHVARDARQRPRQAPRQVVEAAADRILARTVLTSVSTMLPAIGILVAGLAPLRGFAWTIVIGTLAGTLSSIFVVGGFAARALSVGAAPAEIRDGAATDDGAGTVERPMQGAA